MKKLLLLLLSVCLTFSAIPWSGARAEETEISPKWDDYIISFETASDRRSFRPDHGDVTVLDSTTVTVSFQNPEEQLEELASLLSASEVLIEPDYPLESFGTSDPYYSSQWGLYNDGTALSLSSGILPCAAGIDIGFEDVLRDRLIPGSREVIVAILDGPADLMQEELAGTAWINEGEIPGDGKDNDGNGYIDDYYGWNAVSGKAASIDCSRLSRKTGWYHATHVAGIIAARSNNGIGTAGIADSCNIRLMVSQALDNSGNGKISNLISAIRYAQTNGAQICNLSLGTYAYSSALASVIRDSDMLFVCAAGNDGIDTDILPCYPSALPYNNILSVGNLSPDGTVYETSNYGQKSVDILAPGTAVASTIPGGIAYYTGTSMAAPYVTAAAAYLYTYYEGISLTQVRRLILDTAVTDSAYASYTASSGRLHLYRGLTARSQDYYLSCTPVISAKVTEIKDSYKQKVRITVTDSEDDLKEVRYVRGRQPASYFSGTKKGTRLKTAADGTASFKVSIPGIYTIYAADREGNETIKTIKAAVDAPSSIRLDCSSCSLKRGKTRKLHVTLGNGAHGRKLTFSSSDKSIASVTSSGRITARRKGTAVITVRTSGGLKATCRVTVK